MLYNVKAGIIGLEDLGRQFAQLINDHIKNLSLIAACGRTQNELLFAKNDLSLEYVYSDEKSLFENHDIDIVFICSQAHLRPHQAIEAIEAGKHVYILSPTALNVEDAKAIFKVANSKPSQRVMVSSKVKFTPLFRRLKETIDDKVIGKIRYITMDSSLIQSMDKEFNKPSGSLFLDNILDEIELCLWMVDQQFTTANVRSQGEVLICQAEFGNAAILDLILLPKTAKQESFLTIFGDKGQIILSNKLDRSFTVLNNEGRRSEISIDAKQKFLHAEYLQLNHYVNVIMGKDKFNQKLSTSVSTLTLALAFEKSKVLGEKIMLEEG